MRAGVIRRCQLWGVVAGLAAGVLSPMAWGAPQPLTVADAEAATAEGLHGKAGAIYLEIYERTAERALLAKAAHEMLGTKTPAGRVKAGQVAQRYLATATTAEQEQEALGLVELVQSAQGVAPPGGAPPQEVAAAAAGPAGATTPAAPGSAPVSGAPPPGTPPPGTAAGQPAGPVGGQWGTGPASPTGPVPGWGPGRPTGAPAPPSPSEVPPGFERYVLPAAALAPGSTSNRVPFAQRGKVGVELSTGFASRELSDRSGLESVATSVVVATIPIARASFFETRAPLSLVRAFGSPTFGLHHVAEVADGVWITGGGAMGFPLIDDSRELRTHAYPRALWDAHLYFGPMFPFQARFELEYHAGPFGLRLQLEPALWLLVQNDSVVGGSFPHALELQLGHEFGGGLRLQGVAASNGEERGRGPIAEDAYQFALNPFFTIHRDEAALRVGMMLPLDEQLGPPFERSFGLLLDVGVNLD